MSVVVVVVVVFLRFPPSSRFRPCRLFSFVVIVILFNFYMFSSFFPLFFLRGFLPSVNSFVIFKRRFTRPSLEGRGGGGRGGGGGGGERDVVR